MSNNACLIILLVAFAAVSARADAPLPVQPNDQVQFHEKTVQAQMQELQERMFRLGELTREAEPDDSARLLMAVRKAREGLIIEQMKEILDVLSNKDLNRAADDETQVIAKLEELKKLLTTTDLDLQLQLQRLRDLNKAIAQLDAAIKDEKRQSDHSGELAKIPATVPTLAPTTGPAPAPAANTPLEGPKQEQQQTRRTTETIAQTVKDLGPGPAKAGDALGSASQAMSLAEGHLGGGKPSDAQVQQTQAVASMQQARSQLDAERQKIIAELEREVRKQVVLNLTEMLERQKAVREATQALGGEISAAAAPRTKQLAAAETNITTICDQTIALIEETEFSVALPPALRALNAQCALIVADLQDNQTDAPVVMREKQVEQDLADLLDTFKQLASSKQGDGQCRGCKDDKNKLLAELRVIRMLQVRVNVQTEKADGERAAASSLSPELKEKILAAKDGQGQVRDATDRIHQQLTAP